MFITFEGPDGAGKTTQIALLAKRLQAGGVQIVATREPGGTLVGQKLRDILLDHDDALAAETEALLMSADRAEHVRKVILPALNDGHVVISDRYMDSTLAYQGGGRGLPLATLRALQEFVIHGVMPDLTVLLDLPVRVGLERRLDSEHLNRLDRESVEFHERVAATFRQLAGEEPGRWLRVDATQNIEMVHTAIWSHVAERLQECRGAHVRGGSS